MKIQTACILLSLLVPASLACGADSGPAAAACRAAIDNNCLKCHDTVRICHEVQEPDADAVRWRAIISEMAEYGDLSQAVQDEVLTCITTHENPSSLVCDR